MVFWGAVPRRGGFYPPAPFTRAVANRPSLLVVLAALIRTVFVESENLRERFLGGETTDFDVVPVVVVIVPARTSRDRGDENVGPSGAAFDQAHLRSHRGVAEDIEQVARGEVVQVRVEPAEELPPDRDRVFDFVKAVNRADRRENVHRDDLVDHADFFQKIDRERIADTAVDV